MKINFNFFSGYLKIIILFLVSSLSAKTLSIQIRHALEPNEIMWGLMKVESLPANEGMLFTLSSPQYPSFWMFNCNMDLSIAYLSKEGIIQEIYEMKAYPQLMDPKRPVNTIQDFDLYPPSDPIRKFYSQRAACGKYLTYFALEMNKNFFKKNEISIGDRLVFEPKKPNAFLITKD